LIWHGKNQARIWLLAPEFITVSVLRWREENFGGALKPFWIESSRLVLRLVKTTLRISPIVY
jgi:hypothetical protein